VSKPTSNGVSFNVHLVLILLSSQGIKFYSSSCLCVVCLFFRTCISFSDNRSLQELIHHRKKLRFSTGVIVDEVRSLLVWLIRSYGHYLYHCWIWALLHFLFLLTNPVFCWHIWHIVYQCSANDSKIGEHLSHHLWKWGDLNPRDIKVYVV